MWTQTLLALVLALQIAPSTAPPEPIGVGPEPARRPISWELDFRFEDPKRIEVEVPGRGREVYWYMLYTARNPSPQTVRFFPIFELVTQQLEVIPTDMGIHPIVFQAIRERHKLTYPYLVPPSEAIGPLRTGDDYARESVAIWRGDALDTNSFKIFVQGLSGEARVVANPAYDPDKPETPSSNEADASGKSSTNPRLFTLRKTLEIDYEMPGSAQARQSVQPQRTGVRWIMR